MHHVYTHISLLVAGLLVRVARVAVRAAALLVGAASGLRAVGAASVSARGDLAAGRVAAAIGLIRADVVLGLGSLDGHKGLEISADKL